MVLVDLIVNKFCLSGKALSADGVDSRVKRVNSVEWRESGEDHSGKKNVEKKQKKKRKMAFMTEREEILT